MNQHGTYNAVKTRHRWDLRQYLLFVALWMVSGNIWAHHPLDGVPMQFYWHGLLSGIAHPVLGLDHLVFGTAIAVTVVSAKFPIRTLMAVLAGLHIGLALAFSEFQVPWFELIITISLFSIGSVLLFNLKINFALYFCALIGFSIFHGIAYGQALVKSTDLPAVVIFGFITGLIVLYCALIFFVRWLNSNFSNHALSTHQAPRYVGLVAVIIGVVSI